MGRESGASDGADADPRAPRTEPGGASVEPAAARCGTQTGRGLGAAVDAGKPADLADVLRMLDRLPLTDAERAEAVRRVIAEAGV